MTSMHLPSKAFRWTRIFPTPWSQTSRLFGTVWKPIKGSKDLYGLAKCWMFSCLLSIACIFCWLFFVLCLWVWFFIVKLVWFTQLGFLGVSHVGFWKGESFWEQQVNAPLRFQEALDIVFENLPEADLQSQRSTWLSSPESCDRHPPNPMWCPACRLIGEDVQMEMPQSWWWLVSKTFRFFSVTIQDDLGTFFFSSMTFA